MKYLKILTGVLVVILVSGIIFTEMTGFELDVLEKSEDQNNSETSYEPLEPGDTYNDRIQERELNISKKKLEGVKSRLIGEDWELTSSGVRQGKSILVFRKDFGRSEVALDKNRHIVRLNSELRDIEAGEVTVNESEAVRKAKDNLLLDRWELKGVEVEEGEYELNFQYLNNSAEVEVSGSSGDIISKQITY